MTGLAFLEQRSDYPGFAVRFLDAGGYNAPKNQLRQINECTALKPTVILIGAVSSDAPELLAAVEMASRSLPVIGLVNELHSDALAATVGVDWANIVRHLAGRYPVRGAPMEAVLLSGPPEAGWVAPLKRGLMEGLAGSSATIVATYGANIGTAEQLHLIEKARAEHLQAGLVIGTAPAIEAAMALGASGGGPAPAATYTSHSVARGLTGGQVMAAPFDDPMQQGRLAVDATDAILDSRATDKDIRTQITVLVGEMDPNDLALSPADYFPHLD